MDAGPLAGICPKAQIGASPPAAAEERRERAARVLQSVGVAEGRSLSGDLTRRDNQRETRVVQTLSSGLTGDEGRVKGCM